MSDWKICNNVFENFTNEINKILSNDEKFKQFKQNDIFRKVIGNDVRSEDYAKSIYKIIQKTNPELLQPHRFKSNDSIGSPYLYWTDIGQVSPGTLYFIMILSDLITHFGNISNKNIIEIGSGYGGQCKIITEYGCKSYTIVDIDPTIELAKKYLELLDVKFEAKTYPNINITKKYDIVISNWCLSELSDETIDMYIDKIISKCKFGYFYMNLWDPIRKKSTFDKLSKYFSIQEFEENPKTNETPGNNYLWVCKKLTK